MQFVWLMTTVVLFISFFDNGNVKGNDIETQVTQKLQEMTDLKESIQKYIEWYISSCLNNDSLKKLTGMVQGFAKEKVYRINLRKKTESMEKAYGQKLEDLVTTIENIDRQIENRILAMTNATEVSFGSKLEETVRTIEQKFTVSLSRLNETLGKLYEQFNQWRVPKQAMTCCDNGWKEYQGSCYLFAYKNQESMSWRSAKDFCDRSNSHLLRIDNQMEFDFISSVLWEMHDKNIQEGIIPADAYWTGGNDISNEGQWVWSPGDVKMIFTVWSQGEPNDKNRAEDCGILNYLTDFKMNDINCWTKIKFICEKLVLRQVNV